MWTSLTWLCWLGFMPNNQFQVMIELAQKLLVTLKVVKCGSKKNLTTLTIFQPKFIIHTVLLKISGMTAGCLTTNADRLFNIHSEE